jgi:hypothetical protein
MTNNKQQTAVDVAELAMKLYPFSSDSVRNAFITGYNKAKEMDKEKLTDAYCDGKANGMDISHPLSLTKEISADEWYNETYGGGEQ